MKFSKPISREVDIDGNTFNVTFSDTGIEFRLKGKRKTARTDWTDVLNNAKGEQGESAHELLGIESGAGRQESQPQGRAFETEPNQQSAAPFEPQQPEPMGETQSSETMNEANAPSREADESSRSGEELSRSVTAGEAGPES